MGKMSWVGGGDLHDRTPDYSRQGCEETGLLVHSLCPYLREGAHQNTWQEY